MLINYIRRYIAAYQNVYRTLRGSYFHDNDIPIYICLEVDGSGAEILDETDTSPHLGHKPVCLTRFIVYTI